MAKSKKFEVSGVIEWARLFEDNRDFEGYNGVYQECEGAYTLDLLLNDESKETFESSGSAKKLKEVEGKWKVKFVRKHKGPFKKAGGPPVVVWKDGSAFDADVEGMIGNGTTGTVEFEVYPTKAGINGTRLLKVLIDDLVEYTFDDDDEETPV